MPLGEVVPFTPALKPRVCSLCVNGYLGAYGVYCITYNEHVNDEAAVASDCECWEEA